MSEFKKRSFASPTDAPGVQCRLSPAADKPPHAPLGSCVPNKRYRPDYSVSSSTRQRPRFRRTGFMEYVAWSFRLDIARPDHLAPLLGFLSDELAEVSGRTRKHRAAELNE